LELLLRRNIFAPELISFLDSADSQDGRLTIAQSRRFITTAMETFKWHDTAASSYEDYVTLKAVHPIIADIACFRSAHINHLTPRTLDIISAQDTVKGEGLKVKERIEGPQHRQCPILLRQTSFLAIQEPILFFFATATAHNLVQGSHRARFGEIEERGAAVTPKGRELYDSLLAEAAAAGRSSKNMSAETLDRAMAMVFEKYPDRWDDLRKQDLVYFLYLVKDKSKLGDKPYTIDQLAEEGVVDAIPITYEDFLPLSAAGIFQSNLRTKATQKLDAEQDVEGMEAAL
jgi:uncharacterized glyoxalase superfamily metalloenzyme YdcJ